VEIKAPSQREKSSAAMAALLVSHLPSEAYQ
jgi:hypothetical protein